MPYATPAGSAYAALSSDPYSILFTAGVIVNNKATFPETRLKYKDFHKECLCPRKAPLAT
ncbi:hypothetical protein GCM10023333_28940 [Ferrimonas pelagia]|uniref:Uncharacterized protein n=1 Tax=Ferrimonas pelagia TaxID=1177826 RepID=A0ABP9F4S7_9GAMM